MNGVIVIALVTRLNFSFIFDGFVFDLYLKAWRFLICDVM